MQRNHDIDLTTRKYTSRLIVEGALARGWSVTGFDTNPAIFLMEIPGKEHPLKVFSASPPQMSYPAVKVAKDKYITNRILEMKKLPVPKDFLFSLTKIDDQAHLAAAEKFIELNRSIVVKPLDASHGNGITVNVTNKQQLLNAISIAKAQTSKNIVLLQEQVEGHDIRILCIDYNFVDSITRVPASVVGDGHHTISELIDITNASDDRGENYKARLNYIPKDKVAAYLGEDEMHRTPPADEVVKVMGISNVGVGGERKNIKASIPQWLKEIAESAARTLELPVCGVDFLVNELPTPQSTPEQLKPLIIEVNECPMLTMYENLQSHEQKEVINRYLDYLLKY